VGAEPGFPRRLCVSSTGSGWRDQGDYTGALTEFLRALEIDPSNELASQDIKATREKLNSQTPAPENAPRTTDEALELAASHPAQTHLERAAHPAHGRRQPDCLSGGGQGRGINVLFDPAYSSKRIQVDLQNVTLSDGLRIVATVSTPSGGPSPRTLFLSPRIRRQQAHRARRAGGRDVLSATTWRSKTISPRYRPSCAISSRGAHQRRRQ